MYRQYMERIFYYYEVLLYDRKSRLDDKSLSVEEVLERHDQILNDYAERHLNGPIPEKQKYKEIGSGESMDERPEILRLLKDIENPAIKAILVVDIQRLSRGDLEDAGRLIKLLRYSNTCVITPMRTYDLRDEYDRDAFERELKKGNDYLEYFKKIQQQGTLASVKAGNYVGSVAPYGFNRIKIQDGKKECFTLIENKEEADVVRLVFDWYVNDNVGATGICRRLESMNIKTKTGLDKWKPSMIFKMLENVHYIGYVRWNWRKTIKIIEDQEVKILRPKAKTSEEYLTFKGKHEGIISEELFNKAATKRGSKPKTRLDNKLKNPFSGIIICKKCRSKLSYNSYVKNGVEYAKPRLRCNSQTYCKTGSVEFDEISEYICKTLRDCISDFEVLVTTNRDDSYKLHHNLIDNLEKKLKALEEQELLQWKAQTDPDPSNRMPTEVFQVLNDQLLKEKAEIKEALCKAKDSIPVKIDYKDQIVKFTDALAALKDPDIPADIKNQYLKNIIEYIEYERGESVKITKDNYTEYNLPKPTGIQYYKPSFKINIKLKS